MKKVGNYIIFILIAFMFVLITPKADSCTYKEQAALNKEASNIKFNYEVVRLTLPDGYYFTEEGISDPDGNDVTKQYAEYYNDKYIKIMVTNLPENFYFKIEDESLINENNNKDTYYKSDEKDSVIELKTYNINEFRNVKFSIYSNECGDKKLLNKYLKIPRSNQYYYMAVCEDIPDYKYCQEFLFSNVKSETIYNKIIEYKDSLEKKEEQTVNKINWKKIIMWIGVIVVIGAITTLVVILIQKKLREKRV